MLQIIPLWRRKEEFCESCTKMSEISRFLTNIFFLKLQKVKI